MTQMKLLNPPGLKRTETIMVIIGIISTTIGIILIWKSYNREIALIESYRFKDIIEIAWYNNHMTFDYMHGLWLSPLIFGILMICIGFIELPEFDIKKYLKWRIKKGIEEYKDWIL